VPRNTPLNIPSNEHQRNHQRSSSEQNDVLASTGQESFLAGKHDFTEKTGFQLLASIYARSGVPNRLVPAAFAILRLARDKDKFMVFHKDELQIGDFG
jgi:hypothetical protein